jgi:signal peptidase I
MEDNQSTPQPPEPVTGSNEAPHQVSSRGENVRSVLSTIGVLLIAPALALFLTAFVFQSYQVDGPSMQTTLQNNDRLIVWKTPRTWSRITHHAYVPDRGNVIIFVAHNLDDFGQTPDKQLIKRVIGLPGERVVVKNGVLTIYNQQHPNGFQPDKTLPYGNVIKNTQGDIDETVPQDSVFVCGDNRDNSLDSRVFGPVASKDIVGKLVMRVLPIDQAKRF